MDNEMDYTQQTDYSYMGENPSYVPEKKKKKKNSAGKIIALALCFSLLGGVIGSGVTYMAAKYLKPLTVDRHTTVQHGQRENTVIDIKQVDTGKRMTSAEVYASNVESTVGITTSVTTNYWGFQTTSAAAGSGFILTADGYILTNYHVIEGSSSIRVSLYDGTSYDASVIGYDAGNDIAVLKVEADNLKPVTLGNSDNMNVGDTVVAIGNPLGELTFSMTQGIVSAMSRQVTLSTGATMKLIQTDCSINSGNSGGALFNLYGEVIGITNAKYSNNGNASQASIENIGFAIPINDVQSIVQGIIEKGYFAKPFIGVSVIDVSEETQSYGLPEGAAVKEVVADSPAQKAGLQENDIITAVNDEKITGSSDLVALIGKTSPGDVLSLTVYRKGETVTLTLTVSEKVQSATEQEQKPQTNPIFPWGN